MCVHGGSSRELTGEIALSEFRIVFAEVSICPETMKLLQKSLRETHLEATVARFEFPGQIGRKSRIPQFGIIWLVAAKLVFNLFERSSVVSPLFCGNGVTHLR